MGMAFAFRVGPIRWALIGYLLAWATPGPANAKDISAQDLRAGFFLLHDVCHQELPLHLITMVKTTPPDLKDYVDRISKEASSSLSTIDAIEQRDDNLKMKQNPLPNFEQEVRRSIRAEKQHFLLFGTSGASFSRALLITQVEASTYIFNMTKVLSAEDSDSKQVHLLTKMGAHWASIRDEGYRLLGNH